MEQPPHEPAVPPTDEAAVAWHQANTERADFQWFADAPPRLDPLELPGADEADRPVSPWSTVRDLLDTAAIAELVAAGQDQDQARQQIEAVTDRERFERALALGINQEEASAAVDGARRLQQAADARRRRQDQVLRVSDFITDSLLRSEPEGESTPRRPSGDIAADTDGELIPRFAYLERRADRLAPGDLIREPRFGEVRVALVVDGGYDERDNVTLVQVFWQGADGSQAARAYRPDDRLVIRTADLTDVHAIHRALDRAFYYHTPLDDRSARLLAAQLQAGPRSGLYRLAVTGEIDQSSLTELDELTQAGRGYLRRWAHALRIYCVGRPNPGPLPGFEGRRW